MNKEPELKALLERCMNFAVGQHGTNRQFLELPTSEFEIFHVMDVARRILEEFRTLFDEAIDLEWPS